MESESVRKRRLDAQSDSTETAMRESTKLDWMRKLTTGLAALALVGSLLSVGDSGILSKSSSGLSHDETVELEDLTKSGDTSGPLVFYQDAATQSLAYVRTDVVVDEEFVHQMGEDWENRVREMALDVNSVTGQVGLNLVIVSIQRWRSDDSQDSLAALLEAAERDSSRGSGNLLLVITCQDASRYDGFSQPSRGRVIVQYYHKEQRRNSTLIAHEVGHVLGVKHHEQEEECDGAGCIMDRRGYAHAMQWCQHHKEQIQKSIAMALNSDEI